MTGDRSDQHPTDAALLDHDRDSAVTDSAMSTVRGIEEVGADPDQVMEGVDRDATSAEGLAADTPISPRRLAWLRFRRHKLAMAGAIVLITMVLACLLGALVYGVDSYAVDPYLYRKPPSAQHWLGTDSAGRDVLARLLYGGRISLTVGLLGALGATLVGVVLGAAAGYFRGIIDSVLSRICEVLQSFPTLIIIIVVVAFIGPSIPLLITTIALVQWVQAFRVTRGLTLSLREQDSIQAIDGLGAGPVYILTHHILPAVLPAATVSATLLTANVIMLEAGLSFLGLGVPPPTPSWGAMMTDAQSLSILQFMPWMWVPPGVAIGITVLAVNFVGDGLRDAVDPRQSK